ncbi:hypothetical protein NAF17_03440 [Mucilaginibacter sp. RB4R14]|uniref:hypothetical protein n=1 Tax=Mucilaginibacter aurantiaciroseus TaxID=2949308 RepID=UPI002090FF68|nr:hypothetical protein [Mucilaginibacter aurantiaciroseus]MCO5934585.1 hypothetical protein [Mucilaginibacter aurantiaciroseus]
MTINLNGRQFNPGSGFDLTLPSNENFLNTNATIFDAGAGIFDYDGDPLRRAFMMMMNSLKVIIGLGCLWSYFRTFFANRHNFFE